MSRRRLAAAGSAVAIALIAGCGSTVELGVSEVNNQGLGIPSSQPVPGATNSLGTGSGGGSSLGAGGSVNGGGGGGGGSVSIGSGGGSGTGIGTGVGTGTPGGTGAGGTSSSGGKSSHGTGSATTIPSGPISVGFLLTGTSNAKEYGASLGNTVSEQNVDQALVDALNKQGGIAGHKITSVYAPTDTGATNWDTSFQAACATLTQDHHVAVVLGYEFTYEPTFESCLARDGIPHLSDGFNVPSNQVLSAYPYFWSLNVPTIGARNIAKFQGAIHTGFLTTKNKLGVLLDECPGTQQAWTSQVLPYLKSQHINVAPPYSLGCANGDNAGTAAEVSQGQNVLLKFRGEGVDRIAFVSVSEAPVLFLASQLAQSQGYHPGWIVSSLGQLAIIGGESSPQQMKNVRGFGWTPSEDVPPALNPPKNAAQKRCLALLASQGVHPQSAADYSYAYDVCEAMFLYVDALKADSGNPSGAAVSQAIAGVGSHFQSLLNLGGTSIYSNARRNDPPTIYREIVWDGNRRCFHYVGPTYPMP